MWLGESLELQQGALLDNWLLLEPVQPFAHGEGVCWGLSQEKQQKQDSHSNVS